MPGIEKGPSSLIYRAGRGDHRAHEKSQSEEGRERHGRACEVVRRPAGADSQSGHRRGLRGGHRPASRCHRTDHLAMGELVRPEGTQGKVRGRVARGHDDWSASAARRFARRTEERTRRCSRRWASGISGQQLRGFQPMARVEAQPEGVRRAGAGRPEDRTLVQGDPQCPAR